MNFAKKFISISKMKTLQVECHHPVSISCASELKKSWEKPGLRQLESNFQLGKDRFQKKEENFFVKFIGGCCFCLNSVEKQRQQGKQRKRKVKNNI